MLNILKRLTSRYWIFVTACGFLLAGFQFLLCAMVSTVDITGAFAELTRTFPPFLRTVIEQQLFGVMSDAGILAFGWNHPITLALGTAVSIVLASRSIAGEIENGAMELIISQPIYRRTYLTAQVIFALASIAFISMLSASGTLLGQYVFKFEAFSTFSVAEIALDFFLLNAAWYGITLLFSVFSREAGPVATIGFLLALISYFLNVIGGLWDKAAFLLPCSLHTYYSPKNLLVENIFPVFDIFLPGVIASITVGISYWKLSRRDLP